MGSSSLSVVKMALTSLFISEKKSRSDYRVHGIQIDRLRLNAKIGFKKYSPSPKILPKKCQKLACQTKPPKFETFWPKNSIPFPVTPEPDFGTIPVSGRKIRFWSYPTP